MQISVFIWSPNLQLLILLYFYLFPRSWKLYLFCTTPPVVLEDNAIPFPPWTLRQKTNINKWKTVLSENAELFFKRRINNQVSVVLVLFWCCLYYSYILEKVNVSLMMRILLSNWQTTQWNSALNHMKCYCVLQDYIQNYTPFSKFLFTVMAAVRCPPPLTLFSIDAQQTSYEHRACILK